LRLAQLRKFLAQESIDIVNAHTGRMHSLAVAAALGRSTAVVRTRSDARMVRRSLGSGWLYRQTSRVIAAADYIREDFLKVLKLPEAKVVTIYQGMDLDAFRVAPFPTQPVLGIVARLDPVKGHRYLIEALSVLRSSYPDLRLHIIGQEENIKQKDLMNIAERLRLENRIRFLGYRKDVAAAMAECSMGVIASTGSEAVSRAALEWMACGRPVVATRVGCLPELVPSSAGQLVEPRSAPALAQGIARVLIHPERLSSLGRAARAHVEKGFGLTHFVQQSVAVYEQAVTEAR
jgi:glycosyltransferase involved in cell wall biosynthesis